MSSSDSRFSKGSRSRSSSSKKSSSTSSNSTVTANESTATNAYYTTTNKIDVNGGAPLYSAASVSNQYSMLTKGERVTEFTKETWSTKINVSQSNPKLPAALTAQRYSPKEVSANTVTSNSSQKSFQLTPQGPTKNSNKVALTSAVGKSNTKCQHNVQPPVTKVSQTSARNKKQSQPKLQTHSSSSQNQPVKKATTENPQSKTVVKSKSTGSSNKVSNAAPKPPIGRTGATALSKNVSIVPVTNSLANLEASSSGQAKSLKSFPLVVSKVTTTTNNTEKMRLEDNFQKVGQNKSVPSKSGVTKPRSITSANHGKNTTQKASLIGHPVHLKPQKGTTKKNAKSSLPSENNKSKVSISKHTILRKSIKRRKALYPKFSLIPCYKVTGKEPLLVKTEGVMKLNDNLLIRKRFKMASKKPTLPKVLLKTVNCGPVNQETENNTPYNLPKRPAIQYDFKNNILKRINGLEIESSTVEVESVCNELYTYESHSDKFDRAEERMYKRRTLYSNVNVSQGNSVPSPNISQPGSHGVQIISENLVNTLRNDILVVCDKRTQDSTTSAFLTFHSSMNSSLSTSTATTNVTQITTTPIVSSFVKERAASTSKDVQNGESSSILVKANDIEMNLPETIKDAVSSSNSKSKESKSKSKSKSKESSSKSKSKESSKNKSKETSSSQKSKSNGSASSSREKLPDFPATVSSVSSADNITTTKANNSDTSSQPPATASSDATPSTSQTPNLPSTSQSIDGSENSVAAKTSTVNPEDENYDFGDDIRNIMHAFGDSDDPNPDSVKMMEIIVREELNGFVYLCEVAALVTKAKTLHFREAIFALRREKQRLGRLFRYFKHKERHKPAKQSPNQNQGNKEPVVTYEAELRRIADEVDETGEYARLFEFGPETKLADCELRADRIVQRLTMPKFLLFSKARSVSFATKMPRLPEWVVENINAKIPLSLAFVDVLGFLTYEIVAELMNMALLIRSERIAINPMERLVDLRGLNPDTCMSDPTFLKKRCFGLQSVSEILVQAGELQAMRLKKIKNKTLGFNDEYHKQILPIDIREGYARYSNDQLLEPSLSYKCQAKVVANRSRGWHRKQPNPTENNENKQL